jgi:hypothetical protein
MTSPVASPARPRRPPPLHEKDPPHTHEPIAQQEQGAKRVYLSGWSWRRLGVGAGELLRRGAFLGGRRVEREEVVQGLRATMDAKDRRLPDSGNTDAMSEGGWLYLCRRTIVVN